MIGDSSLINEIFDKDALLPFFGEDIIANSKSKFLFNLLNVGLWEEVLENKQVGVYLERGSTQTIKEHEQTCIQLIKDKFEVGSQFSVLDVGCANGAFLDCFRKISKTHLVLASTLTRPC